jgi:EmrB/QacA subfamily drug resistance transporter
VGRQVTVQPIAQPESTPHRIQLASKQGRWLLVATALGSGMIFLDGTAVSVALPRIQSDLAASLSGLQWIINAYTLFLAALLMLGGGIGDTYGRKMAFIGGLVIFTLASIGCGLAPNLSLLISARALQGIGGALLVPGSLAMIKAVVVPQDAGRAIGIWAGLSGFTSALGPLLGGYLVDAVSWRAIFFINAPLAVLTIYAATHVPANRDSDSPAQLDWIGAGLSVIALGGITYALIEGGSAGLGTPRVAAALVVGVLALALFLPWELRAPYPMIPLHTFRSRTFSGANIATLGVYFSFSGVFLFLVLLLQQVENYSPLQAGGALIPVTILLLVLSPRMGGLMERYGARVPLSLGPLIIGMGFLPLLLLGPHLNYLRNILPAMIVIGVGMSIFVTPLTATVMAAVPERLAGVASGISNTLSRVAGLLAVAILGVVMVNRFEHTLTTHLDRLHLTAPARASLLAHADRLTDDPLPRSLTVVQRRSIHSGIETAYLDGFHWVAGSCAILCFLSGSICLITIRDREADPTTEPAATS